MKVDFIDTRVNKSLWANDALSFTGEYRSDVARATGTLDAATFVDQQRALVRPHRQRRRPHRRDRDPRSFLNDVRTRLRG